jgi:hypothetical protein
MAVVDGLRDVYYEFAYKQAKESASLKSLLEKIRLADSLACLYANS